MGPLASFNASPAITTHAAPHPAAIAADHGGPAHKPHAVTLDSPLISLHVPFPPGSTPPLPALSIVMLGRSLGFFPMPGAVVLHALVPTNHGARHHGYVLRVRFYFPSSLIYPSLFFSLLS